MGSEDQAKPESINHDPTPFARTVSGARFSTTARRWLVTSLLGLFALQVVLTSREMSPAWDEAYVVPFGYFFLKTGQWFVPETGRWLVPVHPPLFFALTAIPLLVLNPRINLQDPEFTRQSVYADTPNLWPAAHNFLAANNDDDRLFFWARLPVLLLALLLGYFVYRWAHEMYGGYAGLLALLLYAFDPTIITHSGLTSYDIGLSCFFTLCLYWLWRFMDQGTWHHLLWTGLLLGCALATKTSAVILPPIFVGLILIAVWRYPRSLEAEKARPTSTPSVSSPITGNSARERLLPSLEALALIFLVAFGVLYTIFLFPMDPLFYVRGVLLATGQVHPPGVLWYLMGRFRTEGWWYYFLVAYLIKTPIPMLLLIPLAFWHWLRQGSGWFHEVFLLLPAVTHFVLVSTLADPLCIRYLLPMYPLLFIFVSRTAPLFTRSRPWAIAGLLLAGWYVSTPVRFFPDYMPYFNELVGGPKHGIECLADCNIDWGQNLKRLKRYLDEHQLKNVHLFYYSMGRPTYYGIREEPERFAELARTPEPGVYILSANTLIQARGYLGVDWLKRYELVDVIGYSVYVFRVR